LTVLALLATTLGGYTFFRSIDRSTHRGLVAREEGRFQDLAAELQQSILSHQETAAAFSGIPDLARALEEPTPRNLVEANRVLDHFNVKLHMDACFLVGRGGVTIASSNRAASDSFVGQNYAFRPYFKAATEGRPTVYAALGITSHKRGVYYTHPIQQEGGHFLGAVVMKDDLDGILAKLSGLEKGPSFLVDPRGVIFATNRSDFLFRVLWELPPADHARIIESNQFGSGPFDWSGFRKQDGTRVLDASGHAFELRSFTLTGLTDWQFVYLLDPQLMDHEPRIKALGWIASGILLLCAGLMAATTLLYRRSIREIQTRQRMTEQLRKAKEEIQALVDASPLPILLVDNQGKVQLWSLAAERVFGWKAEEVLDRPIPNVPDIRAEEFHELRQKMLAGKAFACFETLRMRRDGTLLEVAVSTAPIKDEAGRTTGTMAVLEDISGRKQQELQRSRSQTLQSIGILAGGIAHDFNNLLAGVMAVITLLKRVEMPRETALQRLADAEAACKQARDITARLVTFAPGGAPVKKPADLGRLLRSAVEDTLKGSSLQAVFELEPIWVAVDEMQLRQVIQNLAQNALEAMPAGGTLTIRAVTCSLTVPNPPDLAAGGYAKISVIDSGPGIPEATLTKVFDPYFSTKRTFSEKGVGLGLTVCHSVVIRHGGAIRVESELCKGTTFTLWLPRAEGGADE
jgi:PAS domain S-box-containing protein